MRPDPPKRMDAAIDVEGLSFTYPRRLRSPPVRALVNLTLRVRAGEVVGVLGPNGSGKTTLFRVLAGELRSPHGRARVLGLPPDDPGLSTRVGYQPQGPLPFPWLTGLELLLYVGDLLGLPRALARARAETWLERLELAAAARRPHGAYSSGMQRRLALAAALMPEARVLLLDEPTEGLDPAGSLAVLRILEEFRAGDGAVLMASHHLQEVEQSCSRVHLLDEGRCKAAGTLDELLGTEEFELVVRGLDHDGLDRVREAVADAGGEVVHCGRRREHLFALFRRLR